MNPLYTHLQKAVVATVDGELGLVVPGPDDAGAREICFVVFPTTEGGNTAPTVDKIKVMKAPIHNLCLIQSEISVPSQISSQFLPFEALSKVAQARVKYHKSLITGNSLSNRRSTHTPSCYSQGEDVFSTNVQRSSTSGMTVILSPSPTDVRIQVTSPPSQSASPPAPKRLVTWKAVVGRGQKRVQAFPDELYKMQILKP